MGPAPVPFLAHPKVWVSFYRYSRKRQQVPGFPAGYSVTEKSHSLQTFAIATKSLVGQYRDKLRLSKLVGTSKGSDYMRLAKPLMFVGLRFAILCSLPHLLGGASTAQTTEGVTVANNTKPISNEIAARRGNPEAQSSSPLTTEGTVHVLFGLDTPARGVFPTDIFTVADDAEKTGLRM